MWNCLNFWIRITLNNWIQFLKFDSNGLHVFENARELFLQTKKFEWSSSCRMNGKWKRKAPKWNQNSDLNRISVFLLQKRKTKFLITKNQGFCLPALYQSVGFILCNSFSVFSLRLVFVWKISFVWTQKKKKEKKMFFESPRKEPWDTLQTDNANNEKLCFIIIIKEFKIVL